MPRTTKVAISLSTPVLAAAKKHAKATRAKSLSAFVNQTLAERVQENELGQILDQMDLDHGVPSAADRKWAKRVLSR